MEKALTPAQARKRLSSLLLKGSEGSVSWSSHARAEMHADQLTPGAVLETLARGAIWEPAEQLRSSWRYRVHYDDLCVVVVFEGARIRVVTAWRKRR